MVLCAVCTKVFALPQPKKNGAAVQVPLDLSTPHRISIESIRASALSNCTICRRIWDKIEDSVPAHHPTHGSLPPGFQDVVIDKSPLLRLLEPTKAPTLSLGPEDYIPAQETELSSTLRAPHSADSPNPSSTGSHQSLLLARAWLRNCMENHPSCVRAVDPKCPTRLVQIGHPTSDRVCIADTSLLRGQYMSLSHCWGSHQPMRLLRSNIAELTTTGILIDDLPKTFKEAAETTRALGFSYLWIDSLCIIQDSKEDWAAESAVMDSVYGNSVCNIVATASAGCHEGLYRTRNQAKLHQVAICPTYNGVPITSVIVSDAEAFTGLDDEFVSLGLGPVWSRGWILQEIVMAKGLLHFGLNGLAYACEKNAATEMFPYSWEFNRVMTLYGLGFKSHIGPVSGEGQLTMNNWSWITRLYSGCSLTFDSDKLVALSGLARMFQKKLGCPYLAGMFLNDEFVAQLGWQLEENIMRSRGYLLPRPESYTAPTWSWASANGMVRLGSLYEIPNMHLEILSQHIDPVNPNLPFGQLTKGTLRVRGYLQSFDCQQMESLKAARHGSFGEKEQALLMDGTNYFSVSAYESDANEEGDCLHVLLLGSKGYHQTCLMLEPTKIVRGQFRRRGLFFFSAQPGYWTTNKEVELRPSWFEYEEFDGEDKYTVSII